MKLLTKNTDYAIRALLILAMRKDEFISSREIAEKEQIPLLFLRRILQALLKSKIIESKEGVSGGAEASKGSCEDNSCVYNEDLSGADPAF